MNISPIQPNVNQKLKDLTENVVNVNFDVQTKVKTGLDSALDTFEKVLTKPVLDLSENLEVGVGTVPYVGFDTLTIPNVDIPELTIPETDILTTPKPKTETPPPKTPSKTVPRFDIPAITIPELGIPVDLGGLDQITKSITGREEKVVKSPVKWIWDVLF